MENVKYPSDFGELQSFLEIAIDATLIINEQGIILLVNTRTEKLLNYTRQELVGQSIDILVPDASRSNHGSLRQSFVDNPSKREMGKYVDVSARNKLGKDIPVSIGLSPFLMENNEKRILVALRDNSLLQEARESIDEYISELHNITETAIDGIVTIDADSIILSWNNAASQLFGYTKEEALGKSISIIIPQKMRKSHFAGVDRVSNGGLKRVVGKTVEVEGLRKCGKSLPLSLSISTWNSKRGPIYCGILRDISLRIEAEKKIEKQNEQLRLIAVTDHLTGALNRREFDVIANKEYSRSKRNNKAYCILMLDIDHFKSINDSYGHDIGDKALIETVSLIGSVIREEDSLFRLGGEEFAIILSETGLDSACILAERIRASIESFKLHTELGTIKYTISIGLAELSANDESMNATLKNADEALYKAKKLGRNKVEIAKR